MLPLVLHADSMPFLFLFLFSFSPLFSCCLLLGGDGTYNTITTLIQQVSVMREAAEIGDDTEDTDVQRGETPSAAPAAATAATKSAAATAASRDEETEGGSVHRETELQETPEGETQKETEADQQRQEEQETADAGEEEGIPPALSLSSSKDSSSCIGDSCCLKERIRWDSKSLKAKRLIADRERHHLAVTPVPLGTSNTWCSEFLFSHGAKKAGEAYVKQAQEDLETLKEAIARRLREKREQEQKGKQQEKKRKGTGEKQTERRHTKKEKGETETESEQTETETSNAETETETKGTETEKTETEAETKRDEREKQETETLTARTREEEEKQQTTTERGKRAIGRRTVRGGPRQKEAEKRRKETERKEEELEETQRRYKLNGEWLPSTWADLQGATAEQVAFEKAREELDREIEGDWDVRELLAEEGVSDRDKAIAAAARAVRKHSRLAAKRKTDREQRMPFLACAKAALALEKGLLHPKAEATREKHKQEQKTAAQFAEEIVAADMQVEWLASFVDEIGPGKDSNLNRKGIRKMLHFWCRVSRWRHIMREGERQRERDRWRQNDRERERQKDRERARERERERKTGREREIGGCGARSLWLDGILSVSLVVSVCLPRYTMGCLLFYSFLLLLSLPGLSILL